VLQVFIDHCVLQHNERKLTPQMAAEAKLLASELEGRVMDECRCTAAPATWTSIGSRACTPASGSMTAR
jgi:hypothetical protein